jgi:hypothetical protein
MYGSILPTVLDTKCSNIYREERSVADAVAADVIGGYTAGVWDFVMPPVLIFNLLKHRRSKEAFILNLLFTKKLALEAARDMVDIDLTREAALQKADEATGKVLETDSKGVYSDKVRQKQLREIELLINHYHRLIMSEGKTYEAMVKGAYPDRQRYLEFVRRLNQAEKEVNHTALGTVGSNDSARLFVDKMEKSVGSIRQLDADRYFPELNGDPK